MLWSIPLDDLIHSHGFKFYQNANEFHISKFIYLPVNGYLHFYSPNNSNIKDAKQTSYFGAALCLFLSQPFHLCKWHHQPSDCSRCNLGMGTPWYLCMHNLPVKSKVNQNDAIQNGSTIMSHGNNLLLSLHPSVLLATGILKCATQSLLKTSQRLLTVHLIKSQHHTKACKVLDDPVLFSFSNLMSLDSLLIHYTLSSLALLCFISTKFVSISGPSLFPLSLPDMHPFSLANKWSTL